MTRKVYGPYNRKDGRQHVIVVEDGKKRTVSYPRFLLEEKQCSLINPLLTVDHDDGIFTDNSDSNLKLISRDDNAKKSALHLQSQEFVCQECKNTFSLSGRKLADAHHNRARGRTGPYCGRSCAGKATHHTENFKCLIVERIYTIGPSENLDLGHYVFDTVEDILN